MKYPSIPILAAASLALLGGSVAAADRGSQPNIILLFIDDLGVGDIGSFAAEDVKTPNIDSLAQTGVRFVNGYATAPICSPSRAATMTGLYPQRFGVYGNAYRGCPIPSDHPTIAQTLKKAGYVTGMVGRWDLGDENQGPFAVGFDEVSKRPRPMPLKDRPAASQAMVHKNESGVTYLGRDGTYWTELNGPEMSEFVRRHQDKPFYLYYSPLAIHFPVGDVPQKYLDRVPSTVPEERRYMAGTIIALDDAIGELIATLKAEGLFDNTLIFFMGDNGGSLQDGSSNGELRGGKQTQWDGAFRVPYIVSWPAKFPGDRTLDGLVSTLDVYPTAAAAAGVAAPPDRLDGVNLLPYLMGESDVSPHEQLYVRWFDARAPRWDVKGVRSGPWRLLVHAPGAWDKGTMPEDEFVSALYNVDADPGETKDVASENPDVVKDLTAKLSAWEETLAPIDRSRNKPTPQAPMPMGSGWAYANQPETH